MLYLYIKTKKTALPEFDFVFKTMDEFKDVVKTLTYSLTGPYKIKLKDIAKEDIIELIKSKGLYEHLDIYIEVHESLMKYIKGYYPNAPTIESISYKEIFEKLISKYGLLLESGGLKYLFKVIEKDYDAMEEFISKLKIEYGDKPVTLKALKENYVLDDLTYPRTVLISYLRMELWRSSKLKKSLKQFGNDLVLYSMRKNIRKILEDKINYLTTGEGLEYIKHIPVNNIILMMNALDYSRGSFKDIYLILKLYEKGITINDIIEQS